MNFRQQMNAARMFATVTDVRDEWPGDYIRFMGSLLLVFDGESWVVQ